jgi:hypothetical protein
VPWTRGHVFLGLLDHAAGLGARLSLGEAGTWCVSGGRDQRSVIGRMFRRRPSRWQMQMGADADAEAASLQCAQRRVKVAQRGRGGPIVCPVV